MTRCREGRPRRGARDRGRAGLERHGEGSLPRPHAIRRTWPRARWRSGSLPRLRVRGLARYGERASCRGLLWRASGEAETAFPAEAFPGEPRQDAETSFSGLEVRRRRTQWAWSRRGGAHDLPFCFYYFLDGTWATHLMFCLGYPIPRYPTQSNINRHIKQLH